MHRKCLLLIAALTLVAGSAQNARADMCIQYKKTGGGILVAQGARVPAVNTCQPLAMYEAAIGGLGGAATGSICTDGTSDTTLVYHYTYDGCTGDYFESGTCRLQLNEGNLPTTSSTCRITLGGGVFYLEIDDLQIWTCDGSQGSLRVPGGGGGQCFAGGRRRSGPTVSPSGGANPAR
jgi:hypothetical protein